MDADRALKVVVQTARDNVRREIENTMNVVKTGKGTPFANPFTGKTSYSRVSPELKLVVEKLNAAGLGNDVEFLKAFEATISETASSPIFGLFSAFDGEGAFAEEGLSYKIHAKDIANAKSLGELPSGLHDVLFPIEENLLSNE